MKPTPAKTEPDEQALGRLAELPSVPLLEGETPITRLTGPIRAARSAHLPISLPDPCPIAIKRDDLTPGFGNKTRKLEMILADAVAKGSTSVITAGGHQSNHCRQTAQFAAALGLETHLVFGTQSGGKDFPYVGNQVVDRLFGAEVHTCRKTERTQAMDALASTLRAKGQRPCLIPVGGSNALGVLAYAKAFVEFLRQCERAAEAFDRVVVATSSGGTQAGLALGAKLTGWPGQILGISIDQVPDANEPDETLRYVRHMVTIANEAVTYLKSDLQLSAVDFDLNYDYLQDGYGVVGDYDRIGVRTLANHGILAGPVYCGRAFGALLDLISKGLIPADGRTLFWHTGGAGELEFYKDDLLQPARNAVGRS